MVEVEFLYNGTIITIQGNYEQKINDIISNFLQKMQIEVNTVYFLYSGQKIDNKEIILNQIINNVDRQRNKMNIQVHSINNLNNNDIIINSMQVICPECGENIMINSENYLIDLYDCPNGHNLYNMVINE